MAEVSLLSSAIASFSSDASAVQLIRGSTWIISGWAMLHGTIMSEPLGFLRFPASESNIPGGVANASEEHVLVPSPSILTILV